MQLVQRADQVFLVIVAQIAELLDDAAKTAGKTSSGDPVKPAKPVSSGSLAFPDSFAAAAPGEAAAPSPRKN